MKKFNRKYYRATKVVYKTVDVLRPCDPKYSGEYILSPKSWDVMGRQRLFRVSFDFRTLDEQLSAMVNAFKQTACWYGAELPVRPIERPTTVKVTVRGDNSFNAVGYEKPMTIDTEWWMVESKMTAKDWGVVLGDSYADDDKVICAHPEKDWIVLDEGGRRFVAGDVSENIHTVTYCGVCGAVVKDSQDVWKETLK